MRNIIIAVVVILTIAGLVIYRSVSNPADSQASSSPKQLASNTKIYDVRTPEEYALSHIPEATLLPVADIQAGKLPAIPKDTPLAVYCRSGNRSGQAAQLLKQAGYTNVTDLGGLNDLKKYGLEAK